MTLVYLAAALFGAVLIGASRNASASDIGFTLALEIIASTLYLRYSIKESQNKGAK